MGRTHLVDASNSLASPIICYAFDVMFALCKPVSHCTYIQRRGVSSATQCLTSDVSSILLKELSKS
jgi:hypothetical protein